MKEITIKTSKMTQTERIDRLCYLVGKTHLGIKLTTTEQLEVNIIEFSRNCSAKPSEPPETKGKAMGNYNDESEQKLFSEIDLLKKRRDDINAKITGNSPVTMFRDLNILNHKIEVAESHVKKQFKKDAFPQEYYSNTIS